VHKILHKDWNPKGKIKFVGGQNPTIPNPFSPIFHPRNALSMARSEGLTLNTEASSPVDRWWHFTDQGTFLGARYTGDILANVAIVNDVITPCF